MKSLAIPLRRERKREVELARMAHRVQALWEECERLRSQLGAAQARAEELERALAEAAQADPEREAAAILAAAEEEALTIRRKATERLLEATAQLDSLLQVREELQEELRGVLLRYSSLLGAVERPRPVREAPPRASVTPPGTEEGEEGPCFARTTELDAGPFDDFADLSSFERSLASLPSIEDVYIRSFDGARAVIELTLEEERPLLRDLALHVPYDLHVRETGRNSIRLDVEHPAATG